MALKFYFNFNKSYYTWTTSWSSQPAFGWPDSRL